MYYIYAPCAKVHPNSAMGVKISSHPAGPGYINYTTFDSPSCNITHLPHSDSGRVRVNHWHDRSPYEYHTDFRLILRQVEHRKILESTSRDCCPTGTNRNPCTLYRRKTSGSACPTQGRTIRVGSMIEKAESSDVFWREREVLAEDTCTAQSS